MNLFVLRMYVLEGCQACQQAVQLIQSKQIPFELVLANGDPIIAAGNKAMNNGEDKYPVLICNLTKDIIVGYKEDEYARVAKAVDTLVRGQSWSVSGGGQSNNGENTPAPAQAAAGTV